MSESTVDVPAVGHVKRQYVYVGVALVAGIVGYAWWRNASAPATVPAYDESDLTTDGITDTAGGSAGGSANSGGLSVDTSTTPHTDAEWAQLANEGLAGSFDGAALATALGAYLTHQPLTGDQQAIVRAAIGLVGYPPGGHYELLTGGGSTPSALTEPKSVKQSGSTATSVTLTWTAVAGADSYRVYRSGVTSNIGASADNKITVGGLEPAHSYKVHVRALAGSKQGPPSLPVAVKTAGAKLKAPTSLKATTTRTSVHLSWKPVAGADGYRVYRNGVASNVGASRDSSITVSGLKPHTKYTFSVAATAGNSTGPKSAGKSATTRK